MNIFSKRKRTVVLAVIVCVFASFSEVQADSADLTIEDLIRAQLEYFNNIRSLDYFFEESNIAGVASTYPDAVMLSSDYTYRGRIRAQGPLWRSDLKLGADDTRPYYPESFAYNGVKYQHCTGIAMASYLSVRSTAMYGIVYGTVIPPTLKPFGFAYDTTKYSGYDVLKEEAVWRERFESHQAVILPDTVMVGSHVCVVVHLTMPPERTPVSPDIRVNIYFAVDEGYFPVQTEVFSIGQEYVISRTTATDLAKIETGGVSIRIPLQVKDEAFTPKKTPDFTKIFTLERSSIRVNEEMDASDFTIPPTEVMNYRDEDNPENSFSASAVVTPPEEN